jgi:predicted metal-dependent phosphoesterase TrpH
MHNLPFDKPGRFYKGNLHTHSTRSDGSVSPERACQIYRELGYHFLAITDHFLEQYQFPITDTRPYRGDGFTTIIGAELHTRETSTGELWHILAVGLPLDFARTPKDETGPQLAARAKAAGAYVAVAHPAWYNLTESDVLALGEMHAIETINGISADHNDRIDSWYMLDVMLARGYKYLACVTDDCHFHNKHHDLARGWMWVKSAELTPDSLLQALKAGWYYSSTGPEIYDIRVEPGSRIIVRCSPVSSIFATGKGAVARYEHGQGLTSAEFSLRHFDSPYCRVTVRDARGGRAWSNPIWFAV